ncbi:MAG: hypothetical protein OXM02_09000 [Bacteroidota bacterium]|nr:hypothetical protein [Bacteroidota bacterium]MDE2957182.1 hypothetical protein [Bacteroidota bacterium]
MPADLLGDLPVTVFMRDYWHRRPVLLRGALAGCEFPVDAGQLLQMAREPERVSRLITGDGRSGAWEVEFGPFEDFTELPDRNWTLLVQQTDRGTPELNSIMNRFRFIPNWRLDDLQISLAAPGGSAGPHIDQYDVFLIQSYGHRVWQLESEPAAGDRPVQPGLDLAVLQDFHPDVEYTVVPGDILYLPPRVPHWGIAVDECMTCSVGFRAPNFGDMLMGVVEGMVERLPEDVKYPDTRCKPAEDPGRIDDEILSWFDRMLRALLADRYNLEQMVCLYLSRPEGVYFVEDPMPGLEKDLDYVRKGCAVVERTAAPYLMYREFGTEVRLYAAGREYGLPHRLRPFVQMITGTALLDAAALAPYWHDPEALEVLADLVRRLVLYCREK